MGRTLRGRPVAPRPPSRYDAGMRRTMNPALLLAAATLGLASCSGGGGYRAVVAVDEAFVAAYPSLALELRKPRAFEGILGAAFGAATRPITISLSQGASIALDAVRAAGARSSRPVALVASPLVASALLGGGSWKGEPPLLVPEWRGAPEPGMLTASTDPVPAYRRAGAALGAYVAALAREGGAPVCGILFSEGSARPRAALEAFAAAYYGSSGSAGLLVRELAAASGDADAVPEQAGSASAPDGVRPPPQVSTAPLGPEEAVKEMLGSDIRALFIALGPDTALAVRAASRPGLAVGADYPDTDGLKALTFMITPDSKALVEAIGRELDSLGGRSGSDPEAAVLVPARLVIEASAESAKAGGRSLASFIRGEEAIGAR
jgi:hypothetical protein